MVLAIYTCTITRGSQQSLLLPSFLPLSLPSFLTGAHVAQTDHKLAKDDPGLLIATSQVLGSQERTTRPSLPSAGTGTQGFTHVRRACPLAKQHASPPQPFPVNSVWCIQVPLPLCFPDTSTRAGAKIYARRSVMFTGAYYTEFSLFFTFIYVIVCVCVCLCVREC